MKEKRELPAMGLGECLIGDEEEALLLEVIRSKSLFRYYSRLRPADNPPPMATTLEKEASQLFDIPFVHGVTSGTAALETALGALGIGPGDEVILPVWSWISCFTSVVRVGARPVLAEVDASLMLEPREIGRLCGPKTKAVMVIHYQGVGADMKAINAEARKHGLKVLEDCAESFGASYGGKRLGSWGDIAIFSFQNQKVVTAGEGGLVATADPNLYERAVRMSDLGQYRAYHENVKASTEEAFAGANYRMSEMTAAVALAQLRKVDGMIRHLRELRDRLMARIGNLPGLRFRRIPDDGGDIGFETYLYFSAPEKARRFSEVLLEHGVGCSKHTGTYCQYARNYCLNGMAHSPGASPFSGMVPWPAEGYREEDFPKTNKIVQSMVALPIGALFEAADIDYLADAVECAAMAVSED